jgi:hypothetical protein
MRQANINFRKNERELFLARILNVSTHLIPLCKLRFARTRFCVSRTGPNKPIDGKFVPDGQISCAPDEAAVRVASSLRNRVFVAAASREAAPFPPSLWQPRHMPCHHLALCWSYAASGVSAGNRQARMSALFAQESGELE